jgi:2-keto-4-pentenoate hydratase
MTSDAPPSGNTPATGNTPTTGNAPAAYDAAGAAAALHARRQRHERVTSLPAPIAPTTEIEGAAAQRALARLTGAEPPGGFKIGATGRRMQEYLGLSGPIAGFMAAGGIHASGATLRFDDFVHPGVECELAVRLAHHLPPGPCTMEQAADAIGELFAAIEIVENRYGDLAELGTPTLVADQMFHAAAVVGDPCETDWHALDLAALAGGITVDGRVRGEGVGADLLGHPLRCLVWLAGSPVAAAFDGLQAGQVVLLGSVTPPIWLTGPASVSVEFPDLAPVQVRLT